MNIRKLRRNRLNSLYMRIEYTRTLKTTVSTIQELLMTTLTVHKKQRLEEQKNLEELKQAMKRCEELLQEDPDRDDAKKNQQIINKNFDDYRKALSIRTVTRMDTLETLQDTIAAVNEMIKAELPKHMQLGYLIDFNTAVETVNQD